MLPNALKSCPKCNKSTNQVTLEVIDILGERLKEEGQRNKSCLIDWKGEKNIGDEPVRGKMSK